MASDAVYAKIIAYADVEKLFAQWPEAKVSETDLKEYENIYTH